MGKNPKEASSYEILYTKAADKFLKTHEDIRQKYEADMRELLVGEHPESVDVKRIQGEKECLFSHAYRRTSYRFYGGEWQDYRGDDIACRCSW